VLVLSPPLLAEETTAPVLQLEEVVAEGLQHNPEFKAAEERWRAARLRVPQASALPDPMVGYMVMGEMLETRLGPQENIFEVEQMVPFPGKLWKRHQMAAAEANAAKAQMEAAKRDVVVQLSEVYYDLHATDATIATVEELHEILKRLESIAQSRYAAQGGSQRDVAKAQAELSGTEETLLTMRQRRQSLAARLNALLDRDSHSPVGRTIKPDVPTVSATIEQLLEIAKQHRPELQEASAMVTRDRHANTLAKLEYIPDVSVGFQYNQIGAGMTTDPDDGRDAWMVPLKINIPLWQNRLIPSVLEARRNVKASEARAAQEENTTEYEVMDAYFRFTSAKQIVELYRTALIPQAELAFRSDQAGYEAGQVDVLNLIDSERVYLNAQVMFYQALAEALKSHAALERALGTTLTTEGGRS
jgi:outer membrane protein TolC